MSDPSPPAPSSASRDILLTGFPSFVARRLLVSLHADSPEAIFRLLVRPDYVDSAHAHLERMALKGDVRVVSGDVVAMDLGLSGREYLEIVAHVTEIYHAASIWYLGTDKRQTWEVNVLGAQSVLDAAREMRCLERLNHFSTAFVSGDREGVIMEQELEMGQRFRNAYEETKYEAERLMRAAMDHVPISVFRPSIIVGDSRTGEIDKLAGPYYLMYAIMMAPPNVPMLMPGKGDKPLNLVPIDFVTEAIAHISRQGDALGKTFHLCDPNPLSAREVFSRVAELTGKRAPIRGIPYRLARTLMKLPGVERSMRSPRQFLEDFNQLTIYNSINTLEQLGSSSPCPPLPTYIEPLIEHIKRSERADFHMPEATELPG